MIKLLFITFLLCLGNTAFSQIHYTIEGSTSEELEGDKVYLVLVEEDNRMADSTIVVNRKFRFEGETSRVCWAGVRAIKANACFVVLESGEIRLHINGKEDYQCEGTPTNHAFQKSWSEFQLLNKANSKRYSEIDTMKIDKEKKKDLLASYTKEARERGKTMMKKWVQENLNNITPAFWLRNYQSLFSLEEINEMLADASPTLRDNHFIRNIVSTQPNNPFVDADMENTEGGKLKLSDVLGKGNYVLIDIWASWCGACIDDLPKIKEIGEKYASKGLKLLSISIDRDLNDWKKVLERLQLPWEQLHADYSFVNTYAITSIPVLMLISPDGIIVKRNIKIEELDKTLENLKF